MEKLLRFFLMVICCSTIAIATAQDLADYGCSSSLETYTPLGSTATSLTPSSDDDSYATLTLPFSFMFGNATFNSGSSIYVCTNGYITLNTSQTSTTPSTSGSYSVISPLGHDLHRRSGSLKYEVSGSTPNRVLTIEWYNFETFSSANTYNFQVKIYEQSNIIKFCYGSFTVTASRTPYCFLREYSADEKIIALTDWNTPTFSTTSTSFSKTLDASSYPSSGRTYTFTPPSMTCPKPTNLTVSNLTPYSADLSWTAGGSESSWILTINGVSQMVSTNSYAMTGLNPSTNYVIDLCAYCGVDDTSRNVSTNVLTPQIPATLPYTQDWEDGTENSQWTINNAGGSNQWLIGGAPTGITSDSALYISNDNGVSHSYTISSASDVWAYRDIDFGSGYGEYVISFDYYGYGESCCDYLKVFLGTPATPSGNSTPANAVQVGSNLNLVDSMHHYAFAVNSSYSGIQRLYFLWHNDSSLGQDPPAVVDNIHIEAHACGFPYALAMDTATENTVDFHFSPATANDNAWQAVIVAADDTLDETLAVDLFDTAYQFTTLNSSSAYTIYVRTNCGSEVSSWSAGLVVRTECGTISSLPYRENFESFTASSGAPIYCWTRNSTYSPSSYPYVSTSYHTSGTKSLYFYTYTNSTYNSYSSSYCGIVLPQIDPSISINTLEMEFKMQASSASGAQMVVGVMTDPTDMTTFTPVQTLTPTVASQFQPQSVDFSSYTGTGTYIAMRTLVTSSYSFYVDDIYLNTIPTCRRPSNVAVTSSTASSVTVDWTPRNNESDWQLVVVPHGQSADNGIPEYTSTHPYTVNGLNDATEYDVYVKADCGGGDESEWSDVVTFRTKCLPTSTIPYVEGFEGVGSGTATAYPGCWTKHSTYTSGSCPYVSSSYHSAGSASLYFYMPSSYYMYAASQGLDLSTYNAGDLALSFKLMPYSSLSYARIDVGLATNPDDLSTFQVLKSFYPADFTATSVWHSFSLPINQYYADPVYIVFYAPVSSTSMYMYVDEVTVDMAPTCSAPTNLTVSNIAGSSAMVSWTASEYGDGDYTVEYSDDNSTWSSVTTTGTDVMLTGLTQTTLYHVRVYRNCTSGNSDFLTGSFTTTCNSNSSTEFTDGTTTTYTLPVYNSTSYKYSYTQQIFLASEMGSTPMDIQSIAFEYKYATPLTTRTNVDIYLGHTTKSTFASTTDWVTYSDLQLVYSGNLNCTMGWNTFLLDSVFHYNGTDNLVVVVDDNSNAYSSTSYVFAYKTQSPNYRSMYYYNSTTNFDPQNPSTANSRTYSRNNIKFLSTCDNTVSCYAPNAYVSDLDDENITVTWAPGGTENAWELEYKVSTDASYTTVSNPTSPYTISNLTANTLYDIRLRSVCSGSSTSDWVTLQAQTECAPITVPYTETFDVGTTSGSGHMVPCWTRNTNYTTAYPYTYSNQSHSSPYAVYFYATNQYYSYIASPRLDNNTVMDSLQIQFSAYKTSASYFIEVGIMTDPNDYSSFTSLGTFSPSATSTWEDGEILSSGYTGNGRYVAFRCPQWITNYMYIDDIHIDHIPFCQHVNNIAVSSIDSNNVTITWTAGSDETDWDVAIIPGNGPVDLDTVTIDNVSSTPTYSMTDLTPATIYTAYVRANCGNDYSSWESLTFQTWQTPGQLPYFCDFEDGNPQFSFVNGSATNKWCVGTGANNGGTHALYISNDNGVSNAYTITTATNVWAYRDIYFPPCPDGYNFSFDWHSNGESCCDYMKVFIGNPVTPEVNSTANPSGATAMNPNVNSDDADRFNTISNYQTFSYTIPGMATGGVKRLFFYWHNDGSLGTMPPAAVDNISISPIYCTTPSNIAVSNITTSSADVTWTTPATVTNCILYYKAASDADWTIDNNASSPYTLSGLNPSTNYTVRVASDCGDGEHFSPFITETFFTNCAPMTAIPYSENFDSYAGTTSTSTNVLPVCWSSLNGGTSYAGLPTIYNSSSYAHSGSNSLYFYTYASTAYYDQYAILPEIDVVANPLNTLQLSMSARSYSTSYPLVIQVGVMTDPTQANTFQLVETINVSGTAYQTKEAYFTNYTGTGTYIALKVAKPTSGNNYGYIDDIVVDLMPSCSPVSNLQVTNISGTSAMLTWDEGHFGTPSSYTVEYSEAGQDNYTSAGYNITSSPFILSGLDPTTSYDVRVKVNCDDLTESDTVVAHFTTTCLAGGDIQVGNGTTTAYTLPVNNWYHYTYSQQIYLASELNGPATFRSVSFEYAYSSPTTVKTNVVIYLGHTTKSTFTSTSDYIALSNLTQVYSGSLNCHQGWNTFTFTTPFQYNGTDNLVLVVDDNSDDYDGSAYVFNVHSTGSNYRSLYYYSDSYNPDPNNPTAAGATSSYNSGNRSNVKFGGNCDSLVTCIAPNMFVSNITTSTADINWVPGYMESAWEMEYALYSDSIWTPVSGVTGNMVTLTNLSAATHYKVRMRSDCGGGDMSLWVVRDFNTACGMVNIPFSENFNGLGSGNNAFPECWTRDDNYSTSAYPYVSTTDGGSLYYYATTATYNIAVTPELNASVNTLAVNFDLRVGAVANGMIVGVMTNPTNLATFVPIDTVFCTATGIPQPKEVYLDNYTGNGQYVAFLSYYVSSGALYIDNVNIDLIPTCKKPVDLTVLNATQTSIQLSWTERGTATSWNVEYGPAGFAHGSGTIVPVQGTPTTTINGLTASTTYDVYVQADCGGGDESQWSSKVVASTSCDVLSQLPYSENFDAYAGTTSSTTTSPGPMPNCWERFNTYTTAPRPFCNSSTSYNTYPGSAACLYFFSSSGTYNIAIMPEVSSTIPINTLKVTFDLRGYSTYNTPLSVGVMTNPLDGSTYTEVTTVAFDANGITNWINHEVSFANYTGSGHYIAFKSGSSSATCYSMIDNVVLSYDSTVTPVTCDVPTNLAVNNIQQNTATANWTAGGSEAAWDLQYKQHSSSDWGQVIPLQAHTYNFQNLTAGTQYDVRVRANCGSATSNWTSAVSFTTLSQGQDPCNDPTNLTATGMTKNSVVLSWTENGNATSWTVNYKEENAQEWSTATANSNPYTLTGLTPGTTYSVYVKANCPDGQSGASNLATFTTLPDGIADYELTTTLYPNPNNGQFTINNEQLTINNVDVYDVYGKLLKSVKVNAHSVVINAQDLSAGMYFVRISTEKGIVTKNFVKK